MTATIIRGDARHLPLPDDSVDLIVTSPPYWGQRDYRDGDTSLAGQIGAEPTPSEYIANLLECTREWMRALKPTGSLWINLGDKYTTGGGHTSAGATASQRLNPTGRKTEPQRIGNSRHYNGSVQVPNGFRTKSLIGLPWRYALGCIDQLGLILRAEVIWDKPSGMPESVTDRVRRSHEQWFHFTLMPRYHSAVDEIREPLQVERKRDGATAFMARNANHARTGTGVYAGPNPLGKVPGSVWQIAAQPLQVPADLGVRHHAAFPLEWPRRIVRGWSPTGGVVVDPFGGTGTTALIADVLGRRGVSVDRSADYCRIAAWRTTDPGERARALEVPKPPDHGDHPTLFEVAP